MKIYIVLEDRGLLRYRPMFQGVWYDKEKAQEHIDKDLHGNGKIVVIDLDNPHTDEDFPGLLIPSEHCRF